MGKTVTEAGTQNIVRSMREVGEAFSVGQRAIADWATKGMPRKKVGDKYWYDMGEIYEWRQAYEDSLVATSGGKQLAPVVAEVMPRVGELKQKVAEFKVNRADILAAEQMSSLDLQRKIKKLKLADLDDEALMKLTNAEAARWFQLLGVDFAIKYDKEALERSKGVDNVAKILGVIQQLKELDGQGAGDSGV
jgi:hypothetical protein